MALNTLSKISKILISLLLIILIGCCGLLFKQAINLKKESSQSQADFYILQQQLNNIAAAQNNDHQQLRALSQIKTMNLLSLITALNLVYSAENSFILQHDARISILQLKKADAVLAYSADPMLLSIRMTIKTVLDQLAHFSQHSSPNIILLYQNLEALRTPLKTLSAWPPLINHAITVTDNQDQQKNHLHHLAWLYKFLDLFRPLSSLFTIHRVDEKIDPIATPEQATLLQMQWMLKLTTAEAALIARDATIYQLQLTDLATSIAHYILPQPTTLTILNQIKILQSLFIDNNNNNDNNSNAIITPRFDTIIETIQNLLIIENNNHAL